MVSNAVPSEPALRMAYSISAATCLFFYAWTDGFRSCLHADVCQFAGFSDELDFLLVLDFAEFADEVVGWLEFFFSADGFGKGTPTFNGQRVNGELLGWGLFWRFFPSGSRRALRSSTVAPLASAFACS